MEDVSYADVKVVTAQTRTDPLGYIYHPRFNEDQQYRDTISRCSEKSVRLTKQLLDNN